MKCTRKDCNKEAEYIVDGQSVCKDHKGDKEDPEQEDGKTGGQMIAGV